VPKAVVEGKMGLGDAIRLYERERMPKARMMQQVSFLMARFGICLIMRVERVAERETVRIWQGAGMRP
jgi:hypothetical protein